MARALERAATEPAADVDELEGTSDGGMTVASEPDPVTGAMHPVAGPSPATHAILTQLKMGERLLETFLRHFM